MTGRMVTMAWVCKVAPHLPHGMQFGNRWRSALAEVRHSRNTPDTIAVREACIVRWFWDAVIALPQADADVCGYGEVWRQMRDDRTADVLRAASQAAYAARDMRAARLAFIGARIQDDTTMGPGLTEVGVAVYVGMAAGMAARTADDWEWLDPPALLRELVAV